MKKESFQFPAHTFLIRRIQSFDNPDKTIQGFDTPDKYRPKMKTKTEVKYIID